MHFPRAGGMGKEPNLRKAGSASSNRDYTELNSVPGSDLVGLGQPGGSREQSLTFPEEDQSQAKCTFPVPETAAFRIRVFLALKPRLGKNRQGEKTNKTETYWKFLEVLNVCEKDLSCSCAIVISRHRCECKHIPPQQRLSAWERK